MYPLKDSRIIHLFALLHAAVALLCRVNGVDDELLLTLLTIVMTVLVCSERGLTVELTAAAVVVVNVVGLLLGTGCARLIGLAVTSSPVVHAVSTLLTTELLGWGIVRFIALFRRNDENSRKPTSWITLAKLLLSVGAIFALRLFYVRIFAGTPPEQLYRTAELLSSNSPAICLMLCADIIYVRTLRRHSRRKMTLRIPQLVLFLLLTTLVTALVAGFRLPFAFDPTFGGSDLQRLLLLTLPAEGTIFAIVYMIDFALAARAALSAERGRTHQAQYRYLKFKQQVNPHFLFNSLNILDCLVCENRNEQASAYIHKLAGIYRYMLRNEEERLVPLREELEFVDMYADLLRVRFAEGFRIERDIPDEALNRNIVPCSLQLLIENAIKYNVVAQSNPLPIRIAASLRRISVANDLRPKESTIASTRMGLDYIRQQYLDLADLPIEVHSDEREFRVTLPLL